jgi:hypothetical protein
MLIKTKAVYSNRQNKSRIKAIVSNICRSIIVFINRLSEVPGISWYIRSSLSLQVLVL